MADNFSQRTRYFLAATALVAFVCSVLWMARVILLLFFAAALFSILLCSVVEWVALRARMARIWALVAVFSCLVTLIGLAVWTRGPAVAQQFGDLASSLPAASKQVWSELSRQSWAQWLTSRSGATAQISSGLAYLLGKMGGVISGTASFVLASIVVLFATLYLSIEPDAYLAVFFLMVPPDHRVRTRAALVAITQALRSWLIAKAVSMIAIGIVVSLGLWILKVPLAGTLGIIAALMTFIPNLGALASVIPAALLAFAISPQKGMLTVALFALAHFLEGNIVTPLAEREFAKLPPAITLAVQLILAIIAGGLGVALAAPLTAAGLSLLRFFTSSEQLPIVPAADVAEPTHGRMVF